MNYTLTDDSITVLDEDTFEPKTMPATHPAFEEVVAAVRIGDAEEVKRLLDLPAVISDFTQGLVTIVDRVLYLNGKPLDTSATRRVLQFMDQDRPELAKPLIAFIEKVSENPSRRAVYGLYDWAERSGLPITPDGDIIAWKIVQEDYLDIYSGSFDNSVGKIVEVPRNEVDEDPDRTCSHGLHVCSTSYLPHYGTGPGSRVMVVRVHPKDFVAVPKDYDAAKARVCRYEVIAEMPREKAKTYLRDQYVHEPDYSSSWRDGELDVDLSTGSFYRTRDGRVVEIQSYDENSDYPFAGRVIGGDGTEECWTYDGVYQALTDEEDLDLVEELTHEEVLDLDLDAEQPAPEPRKRHWFTRLILGD
jgi:hypothetical protein